MEKKELAIPGAFEIVCPFSVDQRGDFVKVLHAHSFSEAGLASSFLESYYSTSGKGVVRGMHFQIPPHDHSKLVYAVAGEVMDVLLDLRKDSTTYERFVTVTLSQERRNTVYIPSGVAHGFIVKSDRATLVYMTTTEYHADSDTGVLWSSFGLDWGIENPELSDRDKGFIPLNEFDSPF